MCWGTANLQLLSDLLSDLDENGSTDCSHASAVGLRSKYGDGLFTGTDCVLFPSAASCFAFPPPVRRLCSSVATEASGGPLFCAPDAELYSDNRAR